ncbi:outer membrane protein assembly factor BamB [Caldimonas sp. KR1-144]|uniref:outer membrane protein assembly factor BamB n=1 Tax=Caldimonas sp. KR1-144 TaxID=3400911 RepID=UPI003C06651B
MPIGQRVCMAAAVAAVAVLVAACGSSPRPDPTPLEPLKPQIAGKEVWRHALSNVRFPMRVATAGGHFTLADSDGTVLALAADTGRELWRGDAGAKLSAGVGSDGRYAAVVTVDNELVVLDAGKPLWRSRLAARVVTPPLVAGERVFVQGIDRAVTAFDVLDGRKIWALSRPGGDPLTLSQPGVMLPWKDTLVVGQGPRLVGVDPLRGSIRWETAVASPRGTNEVERLADLVGPAARIGDTICSRAFQAAVGCVAAERGVLQWTKPIGGTEGVAADDDYVFGVDASDRITAWKRASGETAWTSERFLYRDLSAPAVVGRTLVFGDKEGWLHFVDRADGQPLLRLSTGSKPVVGAPVRVGSTLLVVTANGNVVAFRPE